MFWNKIVVLSFFLHALYPAPNTIALSGGNKNIILDHGEIKTKIWVLKFLCSKSGDGRFRIILPDPLGNMDPDPGSQKNRDNLIKIYQNYRNRNFFLKKSLFWFNTQIISSKITTKKIGSGSADPDPHRNEVDPKHWGVPSILSFIEDKKTHK